MFIICTMIEKVTALKEELARRNIVYFEKIEVNEGDAFVKVLNGTKTELEKMQNVYKVEPTVE